VIFWHSQCTQFLNIPSSVLPINKYCWNGGSLRHFLYFALKLGFIQGKNKNCKWEYRLKIEMLKFHKNRSTSWCGKLQLQLFRSCAYVAMYPRGGTSCDTAWGNLQQPFTFFKKSVSQFMHTHTHIGHLPLHSASMFPLCLLYTAPIQLRCTFQNAPNKLSPPSSDDVFKFETPLPTSFRSPLFFAHCFLYSFRF